jgi:serine/threonine protein kinase
MTIVGTYGYMAPEQFVGRVTQASDLYSLGATLIYLITGIEPIDLPLENLQIQFEEAANVSSTFKDWLKSMTHPNLNKRFNSAQLALTALESGELTIQKPLFSKINLTKTADSINISIPYNLFIAVPKPDIELVSQIKNNYQQPWLSKAIEMILLRKLWIWLLALVSCLLAIATLMSIPVALLWNFFLFFIPEITRLQLIALTSGAVILGFMFFYPFDTKTFYKALIPDDNVKLKHKKIKQINTLNLIITQQNIIFKFNYTCTSKTLESCLIVKDYRENISDIIFEKKSYKLVEHNTDGGKEVKEEEVPASLYLRIGGKRYGLNHKLTTPELYWLAEELSYFLDIPINWT